MAEPYKLKAGQTLTATAREGRIHVRCTAVSASTFTYGSVSFGPYLVATDWLVDGDATVSLADHVTAANALLFENAGAPDNAVQATVNVNPAGDDNGLTFTAREYGTVGNAITVTYSDPGGVTAALAVSVFRQNITVSLARAASAITSTAAEIKAAIEAHGLANSLVTVAIYAADTGVADDGSGIVTAMAETALAGGAGTGVGIVKPGGLCVDTTNGAVYRNSGTLAAPVWERSVSAATATNDSAAAGEIGEYVSASVERASSVSLTTATDANVTSISLTAGDWDVEGLVGYDPAASTSITHLSQGISTTTATMGALGSQTATTFPAIVPGTTHEWIQDTPMVRLSLAATTTVYLVSHALFTVSTLGAYGVLRARRVR